jgi:aminomuconate-semialdehyde/2-hydroxymuconate-6-semialdehyde dehydrogenase
MLLEICLCGSRIFIHKSIYTSFLSKFIEQTKALTIGNPLTDVNLGALVSLQHLEKVISYVNLAREEGGIVESGGQRILMETGGYFYPPTIITG